LLITPRGTIRFPGLSEVDPIHKTNPITLSAVNEGTENVQPIGSSDAFHTASSGPGVPSTVKRLFGKLFPEGKESPQLVHGVNDKRGKHSVLDQRQGPIPPATEVRAKMRESESGIKIVQARTRGFGYSRSGLYT